MPYFTTTPSTPMNLGTPSKLPLSTFMPRADKESGRPFLPKTALEMARQDEMPSHPMLTGITSQEGAYVLASFFGLPKTYFYGP